MDQPIINEYIKHVVPQRVIINYRELEKYLSNVVFRQQENPDPNFLRAVALALTNNFTPDELNEIFSEVVDVLNLLGKLPEAPVEIPRSEPEEFGDIEKSA